MSKSDRHLSESFNRDRPCGYAEGVICEDCPFITCYYDMTRGQKSLFKKDWEIDKAERWRRPKEDI